MLIRLTQSSRASSEEERAEHEDDNVVHVHLDNVVDEDRGVGARLGAGRSGFRSKHPPQEAQERPLVPSGS